MTSSSSTTAASRARGTNSLINFAPYEPPPDSNVHSNADYSGAAAAAGPSSSSSSSSASRFFKAPVQSLRAALPTSNGFINNNDSSRSLPPWLSVGSYQSGAKPSDLSGSRSQQNAFSSSSSSSSSHPYDSGAGDVLWDSADGAGGGPSSASTSNTYVPPSSGDGAVSGHNQYETSYGWRLDFEAAAAYVVGPILAILLLILETRNDYV